MKLLISVTSVDEAKIALENGADFIDLKDPTQGALGALPLSRVQEVLAFVNAQHKVLPIVTSATVGDLPMQPQLLLEQVHLVTRTGVDIVKIGFFGCKNYSDILKALTPIASKGVRLIAVLFAEVHYPPDLITAIRNAQFYGVMLDTAEKDGTTFLDHYSQAEIIKLASDVQSQNLVFGLAGSLRLEHIEMVKKINPDYVGFRGGVCTNHQRKLGLDARKIMSVRDMLRDSNKTYSEPVCS